MAEFENETLLVDLVAIDRFATELQRFLAPRDHSDPGNREQATQFVAVMVERMPVMLRVQGQQRLGRIVEQWQAGELDLPPEPSFVGDTGEQHKDATIHFPRSRPTDDEESVASESGSDSKAFGDRSAQFISGHDATIDSVAGFPSQGHDQTLPSIGQADPQASGMVGSESRSPRDPTMETLASGAVQPPSGTGTELGSAPSPSLANASTKDASGVVVAEDIEDFEVQAELGRGAYGVVYRAMDRKLERVVAIKVPLLDKPKLREQYIDEARKAARIDSVGIVPIYHVGTTRGGAPYVVQKFIDGPTVGGLLKGGPLTPLHAVMLIRDIARSLAEAHRLDMIHRDLKPANILIDQRGVPWIADFGLAIQHGERTERHGEIAGTPSYMAPEQVIGDVKRMDRRSDIWATGIMLFETLTGKVPFRSKSIDKLVKKICDQEEPSLVEWVEASRKKFGQPTILHDSKGKEQKENETPLDGFIEATDIQNLSNRISLQVLDSIVRRCIAKTPEERFASADELADALDRLLLDSGFDLRGNPVPQQEPEKEVAIAFPTKSGRSSKTPAVIGIAAACVLLLGGMLTFVLRPDLLRTWNSGGSSIDPGLAANLPDEEIERQSDVELLAQEASPSQSQDVRLQDTPELALSQLESTNEVLESTKQVDSAIASLDSTQNPQARMMMRESIPKPPAAPPVDPHADGFLVVSRDENSEYPSLLAAIEDATPDDIILLEGPGVIKESIVVNKRVRIQGNRSGDPVPKSKRRVIRSSDAPCFQVSAEGSLSLTGINVEGFGIPGESEFNAIMVEGGSLSLNDCDIESSTFNCVHFQSGSQFQAMSSHFSSSNDSAIVLHDVPKIELRSCQFDGCDGAGIETANGTGIIENCSIKGPGAVGILAKDGLEDPLQIVDCKISGCRRAGILTNPGARVSLKGGSIISCRYGIEMIRGIVLVEDMKVSGCKAAGLQAIDDALAVVRQSTFQGNNFGVISSRSEVRLTGVTLEDSQGGGISLIDSSNGTLSGCKILRSGDRGVLLGRSKLSILDQSEITENVGEGIYVEGFDAELSLQNSKVSDNHKETKGGQPSTGISIHDGKATLENVTIQSHAVGLFVTQQGDVLQISDDEEDTSKYQIVAKSVRFQEHSIASARLANGTNIYLLDCESNREEGPVYQKSGSAVVTVRQSEPSPDDTETTTNQPSAKDNSQPK